MNNTINFSPNIINSSQSDAQAQAEADASASVSATFYERAREVYNDIPFDQYAVTIKEALWKHRYRLGGSALFSMYLVLCYHLNRAIHYLKYSTVWSSWQDHLEIKELLAQDINKLGKKLIIAIQMRYANDANPTDFVSPLVEFNIQVQKELETLHFYERLHTTCNKWYITKVVPFSLDILQELPSYIERATYTQTLFKNWAAHHNVAVQTQYNKAEGTIAQRIKGFFRPV